MNIVMINEAGEWGGAEKIFFQVAQSFHKDNQNILCILGTKGILYDRLIGIGVSVNLYKKKSETLGENSFIFANKRVPNFKNLLLNYMKLRKESENIAELINSFHADMIYLNNLRPLVLYNNFRKKLNNNSIKTIWHEHGYQRSKIRQNILDNILLENIYKIITVSNHLYCTHNKKIKEKILVINNGIDVDFKIHEINDNKKEVTFIHPAFILPWKGQETVVKAVDELVKKYDQKNFKVKFVGSPRSKGDRKYLESLKKFNKENNLNKYVEFMGFRKDVLNLISNSDVLISSSVEHDPFPTILLEGCAIGMPIISSNAGGSPEIITNGKNGYIFEMGNYKQLAEHMHEMIINKNIKNEFSQNSKRIYNTKFTLERFNSDILKVLEI